ncbi:hypothetical protein GCM10009760_52550 [Kitasatospora kazusensis]|uniref:Uncharacterized protein n=1 Tax=Kitasatospora kazusensis TaxID=407974 RepID=A0ABP5LZF8_9ACTN
MTYLPTLGSGVGGVLTLGHTGELVPFLLDLAERLDDDEAVGEALAEIADLRDRVRRECDLDDLGHAERALDDRAVRLIESLGHGVTTLDSRQGVHAIQQARRIAAEAHRIAEVATAYADRLAAGAHRAA